MEHYRRKWIDNGAIVYDVALKLPEDTREESSARVFLQRYWLEWSNPWWIGRDQERSADEWRGTRLEQLLRAPCSVLPSQLSTGPCIFHRSFLRCVTVCFVYLPCEASQRTREQGSCRRQSVTTVGRRVQVHHLRHLNDGPPWAFRFPASSTSNLAVWWFVIALIHQLLFNKAILYKLAIV